MFCLFSSSCTVSSLIFRSFNPLCMVLENILFTSRVLGSYRLYWSHWLSNQLRELVLPMLEPRTGTPNMWLHHYLPREDLCLGNPLPCLHTGPNLFTSLLLLPSSVWIFLTAFRMPVSSLFPVRTAPQFWCLHGGRWAPCPPPPSWSPPLIDSLVYWTFYLNNKLVSSVINYKSWFLKPVFYISNTYTTGIIILLLTFLHSVTNSNNSIRL